MHDSAMLISTRARVVWTQQDKKLLNRCAKLFNEKGDKLELKCGNLTCPEPKMTLAKDDTDPGGRVLRCGCTDRHFQSANLPRRVF